MERKEFLWEDGRRAERLIHDEDGCEGTRIVEDYVEPKIEKKLAQRVTEKRKPFVYERQVETIDESTGEVVDKVVEATDPRPMMHVIERYMPETIAAQSVGNDCTVTRDELREDIKDAVLALARHMGSNKSEETVSSLGYSGRNRLGGVSAMEAIEDKLEKKKSTVSPLNVALLALISAQVAGLAWILFAM